MFFVARLFIYLVYAHTKEIDTLNTKITLFTMWSLELAQEFLILSDSFTMDLRFIYADKIECAKYLLHQFLPPLYWTPQTATQYILDLDSAAHIIECSAQRKSAENYLKTINKIYYDAEYM